MQTRNAYLFPSKYIFNPIRVRLIRLTLHRFLHSQAAIPHSFILCIASTLQQFDSTSKVMNSEEQPEVKMEEEQIMIMLGEVDQCEGQSHQDLLDILVAEPTAKKEASNGYDYKQTPVPIPAANVVEGENIELKTSNNSTSTCEGEAAVRKCTCLKTRCLKNYCECFKQGLACTSQCVCVSCCNRQRLFLNRSNPQTTKCKCQKSHCLKKYCECHSSGKKCGPACKCLECENTEEEMTNREEYEAKMQEEEICDHHVFLDI